MEAFEGQARRAPIAASSAGTCSASMPNCFGPPPIFMPEPFSSKSGLTRTATRAGRPSSAAMRVEQRATSRIDSTLTSTPAATAWRSSASRLPGPGEADLGRVGAGVERHLQLAGRSDVDAVDQAAP